MEVASLDNATAQQEGTIYLVTADESGTLGRTAFNMSSLGGSAGFQRGLAAAMPVAAVTDAQFNALDSRVGTLEGQVGGLSNRVGTLEGQVTLNNFRMDELDRALSGGIAAAMALGQARIVPDSNLSVTVAGATYNGQQGFAGSLTGRVSEKVYISAGVSGNTGDDSFGGTVSASFGF